MISIRQIVTSAIAIIAVPASASTIHLIGPLIYKTGLITAPALSISIINGPLIAFNQGPFPEVIEKFTDVINSTDAAAAQINGLVFYTEGGDVPSEVTEYYVSFVNHQVALLSLLRDKAALFTLLPVIGRPVTAILGDGQRSTDGLGVKMVAAIDSSYGGLNSQVVTARARLNAAYTLTAASYDGLIGLRKREEESKREIRAFIA
ncbi:hypothetical protein QBC44DRAFT_403996 [Cladorrhinum sp. PSN332]|nr:hypothetical protein QBC44DRAFT_403996 [Cladorrhinum sp. PSN332]